MLEINKIYCGDSCEMLKDIEANSIALSFWSPPYFLGKDYEAGISYQSWQAMLKTVIQQHFNLLKPGGFLVINIADILAFQDKNMPKIMGSNPANRKCQVTKEMILQVQSIHPEYNRNQIAAVLNCSEQTIDRRLNGNNIRGGRYAVGTHVKQVGGNLENYAYEAGLFLYDVRYWRKDPAWANSKWTTNTLKAVSEMEYLYVFWKPGEYEINRERLTPQEWKEWGYRQIWEIPSVRRNDDHPAKFPISLATRVIRLYSDEGDTILDPFIGSGTTALAAMKCNRNFIGVEKMLQYVALANEKVRLAQIQTNLFDKNANNICF